MIQQNQVLPSASGFIVANNGRAVIINSINNGEVIGLSCYGFSRFVATSFNVVSLGMLGHPYSQSLPYPLWLASIGAFPSLFCSDKISSSSKNDCILFTERDSKYYITKNNTLLADVLNINAPVDKYSFYWTEDLNLTAV